MNLEAIAIDVFNNKGKVTDIEKIIQDADQSLAYKEAHRAYAHYFDGTQPYGKEYAPKSVNSVWDEMKKLKDTPIVEEVELVEIPVIKTGVGKAGRPRKKK